MQRPHPFESGVTMMLKANSIVEDHYYADLHRKADERGAAEEVVVAAIHEKRRAAAMALLNQHNPEWFTQVRGAAARSLDERAAGHNSMGVAGASCVDGVAADDADAGAGVERQRAASSAAVLISNQRGGLPNAHYCGFTEAGCLETNSSNRDEQAKERGAQVQQQQEITHARRAAALAEVAKQREAAMALLDEHNADWFGGIGVAEKKTDTSTKIKASFCESNVLWPILLLRSVTTNPVVLLQLH